MPVLEKGVSHARQKGRPKVKNLKFLDLPPVWLAGFVMLAWAQARWVPLGVAGLQWRGLGAVLIGMGIVLTCVAALQFMRHRTSIIPGRTPDQMITGGVYQLSRNPIYLADVLILAGASLWLSAIAGIVLVPIFMLLIHRRFILGEEQRMQARFGSQFDEYRADVRRWM